MDREKKSGTREYMVELLNDHLNMEEAIVVTLRNDIYKRRVQLLLLI